MTPDWYDLLGLPRDASADEIRDEWKTSIADLDPGNERFREFNQAAEVLLDPERRSVYDAQLASEEAARLERMTELSTPPGESPSSEGRGLAMVTLVAAGLVTVAVVAMTIFAWTRPAPVVASEQASSFAWIRPAQVDERAAQNAAEAAIVPVLSFDYRHLEADASAARGYLTEDYRAKYDQTFALVEQNAPGIQTVVSADVIASGIVRSSDDRVDVLLFVNRPTTNKADTEPVIYRDQVTARMLLVGDRWLIDDLITTPASQ